MKLSLRGQKLISALLGAVAIIYASTCLFLFQRQRHFIFQPSPLIWRVPSSPYEDASIPVANDTLHGWWFRAPSPKEKLTVLPNEPSRILTSPSVLLYMCGAGRNMADYLARVDGLRQLGFSILIIDYRGYGQSKGNFPSEVQLYQDSQAAWNYLVHQRQILPKQIFLYGESLGGAVAIDLAVKHPDTAGLIVQSSFTSMAAVVKKTGYFRLFPVDWLLTQKFDSLSKVRSLRVPVLFIHGKADTRVPWDMSQELFAAAPEPKELFLIPDAGHSRIYQANKSYLKAIQQFVEQVPSRGYVLHWEALDEDISTEGLLRGAPAPRNLQNLVSK